MLASVSPLWIRPMVAGDAVGFYLLKLAAPVGLCPDYGRTPQWAAGHWWFYAVWLAPLMVIGGLALARNRRVWLVAAGIFVAWLLPVLGLVHFDFQRISTVADRYLYLALLGPALALAWALARWWNRWTAGAVAMVLAVLAVLGFLQAARWRDGETLFRYTQQVNPRSAVAAYHLGAPLIRAKQHDQAIAYYRAALERHPEHAEFCVTLAEEYDAIGRTGDAAEILLQAADRWRHSQPSVHKILGQKLAKLGRAAEAEEQLRRAVEIDPRYPDAHLELGRFLFDQAMRSANSQATRPMIEEASECYREALELQPRLLAAHMNLGNAMEALGNPAEARRHYQAAVEIAPEFASAHYNLGNLALREPGRLSQAIAHYRDAIRCDPHHAQARTNLGAALLASGNAAESIVELRASAKINSKVPETRYHLGRALAAEGHLSEAAGEFRAALGLNPSEPMAAAIREWLEANAPGQRP